MTTIFQYSLFIKTQSGDEVETRIASALELTKPAIDDLIHRASTYQCSAKVVVDLVELSEKPWHQLVESIDEECKRMLGIIDGAKPDYADARMNDLERNQRNMGREVNQIGAVLRELVGAVNQLTTRVASSAAPIRADVPAPREYEPSGMIHMPQPAAGDRVSDLNNALLNAGKVAAAYAHNQPSEAHVNLTPEQAKAQEVGRTLIGTPPPFVGDMSAPLNPRTKGITQTAEQASGQMDVHGVKPTSKIFQFLGVDAKGEAIMQQVDMPRVNDSLRPLSSKSDIKPA